VHFRVSDGQSARPRTYERLGIQSARFAGTTCRVPSRTFAGGGRGRGRGRGGEEARGWPSCVREVRGVIHAPRRPPTRVSLSPSPSSPFPAPPLPRHAREQLCGSSSDHEGDDKIAARGRKLEHCARKRSAAPRTRELRAQRSQYARLAVRSRKCGLNVHLHGEVHRAREIERKANRCLLFEETLRAARSLRRIAEFE